MGGEEGELARLRDPHLISPNLHCKYICFAGLEFEKKRAKDCRKSLLFDIVLYCNAQQGTLLYCEFFVI